MHLRLTFLTLLVLSSCTGAADYKLVDALPGLKFDHPLEAVSPPGETGRLFVVEQQRGRIHEVDLATMKARLFLDLSTRPGGEKLATANEQGVLGLAFHPDYAKNRKFYVGYTPKKGRREMNRFSQFTDEGDRSASEVTLIDQQDQAGNHNGGCVRFGPDGYLYVGVGDEGAANDSFDNSQRIDRDFFAGILRIDVDRRAENLEPNPHPDARPGTYKIPRDNPFVGAKTFAGVALDPSKVRTEFWAVGLRNPWRFEFDPKDGRLLTGDVGQNKYEEIDLVVKGGNYGWAFREGLHDGPKRMPPGVTPTRPIHEYPRSEGVSVTGGIVYRGSRLPELDGAYLFADYGSGKIWALRGDSPGNVKVELIANQRNIASFGRDPRNGDPLLVDLGGRIWRLEK